MLICFLPKSIRKEAFISKALALQKFNTLTNNVGRIVVCQEQGYTMADLAKLSMNVDNRCADLASYCSLFDRTAAKVKGFHKRTCLSYFFHGLPPDVQTLAKGVFNEDALYAQLLDYMQGLLHQRTLAMAVAKCLDVKQTSSARVKDWQPALFDPVKESPKFGTAWDVNPRNLKIYKKHKQDLSDEFEKLSISLIQKMLNNNRIKKTLKVGVVKASDDNVCIEVDNSVPKKRVVQD